MTSSRSHTGVCGCRGARTCLLCEGEVGKPVRRDYTACPSLYPCYRCGEVRSSLEDCRRSRDPALSPLRVCSREPCKASKVLSPSLPSFTRATTPPFDGVTVVKEFITKEEEAAILSAVDSHTWIDSQSGRRKQVRMNFEHNFRLV